MAKKKELAKANPNAGLPANLSNMATGLAQSVETVGEGASQYMKMDRQGVFMYGVEDIECEDGATWAVNPAGFWHGWIAWGEEKYGTDGQMLGEHFGPAHQPLYPQADLDEVEGKWAKQIGITLRCVDGEDAGVQCLFKSNSVGGRKAYAALLQKVVAKLNDGDEECVPLVRLNSSSYKHKSFGKIFNPEFIVTGWTTMDVSLPEEPEDDEDDLEEEEQAPEPKPKRKRKAKVEEPEEPEDDDDDDEEEEEAPTPPKRKRRTKKAEPPPEDDDDDDDEEEEATPPPRRRRRRKS